MSEHGEGVLKLERSAMRRARHFEESGELKVGFPFGDVTARPDLGELPTVVGAVRTGPPPVEYGDPSRSLTGGAYQIGSERFGLYRSASASAYVTVHIFEPDEDAVRFLLGGEFVSLLETCATLKLGPVCRTSRELRVGVPAAAESGRAQRDSRFTKLERVKDGWLSGRPGPWMIGHEHETLVVGSGDAECVRPFPALSPPAECELEGDDHRQDQCIESASCTERGLCLSVGGECRATLEDDCERSKECSRYGRCFLADDVCTATEAHCRSWPDCGSRAQCTLIDGRCEARAADCRRHADCQEHGKCSVVDGRCAAVTGADCAQSEACTRWKACKPVKGQCR